MCSCIRHAGGRELCEEGQWLREFYRRLNTFCNENPIPSLIRARDDAFESYRKHLGIEKNTERREHARRAV